MMQVRVMTWNVENLFPPGDDAGPDTQATLDRKIASLAAVIDQSTPDVLALQEVGPTPIPQARPTRAGPACEPPSRPLPSDEAPAVRTLA